MRMFGLFALLLGMGLTVGCEPAKKPEPAPVTPPAETEGADATPAVEGADAATDEAPEEKPAE